MQSLILVSITVCSKTPADSLGFIAVSFASNSVAIIDMRGPDVILREGFNEDGVMVKKRKKKGNVQNVPAEHSVAEALKWVVSGMGTDASPKPRLIVSYTKGYVPWIGTELTVG